MKKFLKVFSLLWIICIGMFLFTGCADSLTEEQKEKVMTVVDNADVFMEDVLENLDKNNSKLGREESFKALRAILARLSLNVDDVWSNLEITMDADEFFEKSRFFKSSDGNYICVNEYIDSEGDESTTVSYSDISSNLDPIINEYTKHGDGHITTDERYEHFVALLGNNINVIDSYGFSMDDVLSTDVLDNGNNYISMLLMQTENPEEEEFEVTWSLFFEAEFKDEKLYSMQMTMGTVRINDYDTYEEPNSYTENPSTGKIFFKYGEVDIDEMEKKYKEAKDYIESHS